LAEVFRWALALNLVVSVYTVAALILGARRGRSVVLQSARNGVFSSVSLVTVSLGGLLYLLITRDFRIKYVYEHVSTYLPPAYTVSALWAGQEGSLLVWTWLVVLLSAAMALPGRRWEQSRGPYATAVLICIQAFMTLTLVITSSPFEFLPSGPIEGQGLNPLLESPWMIVHPPVVFMGYAGYAAPFALAVSGLVTGQLGKLWVEEIRRWALAAWLFLGAGLLLGALWAYIELGWGGYWGWDPVENSSLLPWLSGTALLHSLAVPQRGRSFVVRNTALVALSFALCMFATVITRSGVLRSVHGFGRSPVGSLFMAFIFLCLSGVTVLLYFRRQESGKTQDLEALLSREASVLVAILLLGSLVVAIFLGTMFPAFTELLHGRQVALGASFFERTVGPLGLATIFLIGVCSRLAWRGVSLGRLLWQLLPSAASAGVMAVSLLVSGIRDPLPVVSFAICAFVAGSIITAAFQHAMARDRGRVSDHPRPLVALSPRIRRRCGAHVIHMGVMLIAIGITGSTAFQSEAQMALAQGERIDYQGYSLQYMDTEYLTTYSSQRTVAVLELRRGGRKLATLRPQKNFYWSGDQWVSEVAIHTSLREDFYAILTSIEPTGVATLHVLINPLVLWIWIGGAVLLGGGVLAWWPSASVRRRA
jgi:cytochrome c-type biogenesis protein CcmF